MNVGAKGDNAVSSTSTSNSSFSSQSNVRTPSPKTPSFAKLPPQPGTPPGSIQNSQASTIGSLGHKNSLKGTKLARRARSFKDDLFEKISLMRTPTNMGRSHSPHSPRNKHTKRPPTAEEMAKSAQSLETHVKDISNALKHFRDVFLKKKLEVLPGNATVILETIASMFSVIQSYTLNENSTILLSATQQVYQSLGKLIKLCDEVMLSDDTSDCPLLSNENVREVVDFLEDAVRNLVTLAQEKLKEKEDHAYKYGHGPSSTDLNGVDSHNHLIRPPVEVSGQRTSLPDIMLTSKERDILEKTKSNPIRASHSTESILRDTSPSATPPLPNSINDPPPLPPKRRHQQYILHSNNISINSDLDCSSELSLMNYGVDHLSVRSRSPDENSSQCSFDSALNQSREEEELKAVALESRLEENLLEDDVEKMFTFSFISMKSFRTSNQNVSKRSSNYSFQSSTKSSNPEIACGENSSNEYQLQQSDQHTATTISASYNTIEKDICQKNRKKVFTNTSTLATIDIDLTGKISDDNQRTNNESSRSPEQCERENLFSSQLDSKLTKNNSLDVGTTDNSILHEMPPALPPKMSRSSRLQLQSDNFDHVDNSTSCSSHDFPELRQNSQPNLKWQTKHRSLIEHRPKDIRAGRCNEMCGDGNYDEPPPLPIKKKYILAYMEICSSSTRSIEQHRHTMHAYNLNRQITHSQTMNIVPLTTSEHEIPPALPPKNYKQRKANATPSNILTTPPPSPKPAYLGVADNYNESPGVYAGSRLGCEFMSTVCEEITDLNEDDQVALHHSRDLPNEADTSATHMSHLSPKRCIGNYAGIARPHIMRSPTCPPYVANEEDEGIDVHLDNNNFNNNKDGANINSLPKDNLPNMLEELDIMPYIIFKKDSEDGPEVKGGYIDALIVHACRVQKVSDNAFSEAFITTFRTFIQPIDVVEKLTHRYTVFFCQLNDQKQKAAKETFSLLVRVVNDLTSTDLTNQLYTLLVEFVHQLVCSGQLYLAKLLRNKIVEKVMIYKEQKMPNYQADMYFTVTNQPSLLELKSLEIAEQMTLLDAELFQKIEIPEVLLFAKEQCEEKSPNLNKFTEHFNKMSYWARSKILMLQDAKEREKHVIKFIKIMKHLRKMNNYNSYLALLSALDSAPIRRLEWHKTITEGLKEYCTLIDSSSSFRVYRQALAETNPPCIPYIGLVLQDLTFVHVGNPDYLKEDVINFSKRWQQHNIIVNMKRFRKCSYPFRRNERVIRFFENFENFLGEEEMWQISENIKPRTKRPNHT